MSNSAVAKRYAQALFELAQKNQHLDAVEEEMRTVKAVFTQTPELYAVLSSPRVPTENKKKVVSDAFKAVSPLVLNTLMLLIDRRRIGAVEEIAEQLIQLVNEAKGIAAAVVYSARPLTKEEEAGLSAALAPKVGKQSLKIENRVDQDLLGGVKVQIGNTIFDGSLKGKLTRLERQLIGSNL
ncbi:ATP synthase F0F1 subunit delta [Bacillus coahuilensis p1.1.43]|uniref:ATP synthase subunit delta n=1 Tax=Bacillus coahuilensis p1.1.43 TaxID=1150625 RepID=A0A147K494_9BACI|nr:F0F1 ATP synthase subunit delta [Bacillus coahuilensis]KUP04154.1 ATP synthase F0F1 subunit delta [Bacillus coahuilensis p1.1.43]